MRRPLALAAASLTFGFGSLALVAHGCGGEPAVEDVCGWLGDQHNCYRRFAEGVVEQRVDATTVVIAPKCGVEIVKSEAIDPVTHEPFGADDTKPTSGAFLARDKLDVCILSGNQGGQIVFDPPLDPALFPATGFSFKMIDGIGKPCGSGSFAASNSFSIGFDAPMGNGGGGAGGSGTGGSGGSGGAVGSGGTGGRDTSPIFFGTFSMTQAAQRDVVDTLCPNEEAHHFNLLQLDKCERFAGVMPTAEVESASGGVGVPGFVRLRVLWPLTNPDEYADTSKVSLDPIRVEYFDCAFPGPPSPCKDGVQGGAETDVDCGKACDVGCLDKQGCIINQDCASRVCTPNAMGIKKCVGDTLTAVCLNAADDKILKDPANTVLATVDECGQTNGAVEPATFDCIQAGTGLSKDCSQCFDDSVQCAVDSCFAECLADPAASACIDCRTEKCNPALKACTGL